MSHTASANTPSAERLTADRSTCAARSPLSSSERLTAGASARWPGTMSEMSELPLTGGCNCGAVRFEVTAPLLVASYCHCKRCQRRSGAAASANAHPAPGTFRIVAGEDGFACGSLTAAAKNGSAATAAPHSSAATRATPIQSASAWAHSTTIPASGRASASSSPTPRPGSRSPTTERPATPRAVTARLDVAQR